MFEFIGWYAIGTTLPVHMTLHQQFMEKNEGCFFMLLNPEKENCNKKLPLVVYESEVHMVSDATKCVFVKTNFVIKTNAPERIAVDHMAKISTSSDGASAST